jgi:hypothetical protein
MAYLFTPPQRTQYVQIEGSLRYSYPVSQTVWKDGNGVWQAQEAPTATQLGAATQLLAVPGGPCFVDSATAAALQAAGIGTITIV